MESRLLNTQGTIRANCNVLQAHQLASYLPDDDEYDLQTTSHARMVFHIYG